MIALIYFIVVVAGVLLGYKVDRDFLYAPVRSHK